MDILKDLLYPTVAEAKEELDAAEGLRADPEAPLFGQEGGLDSLGLVQFVVMVEDRLEDLSGRRLTLVSEQAMSRRASPFSTLGALAAHVEALLAEEQAS